MTQMMCKDMPMPCKQAQAGTTSLIATVTLANPRTLFFALLKRGAALSILLSHHTAVSPHCCLTTLFSVLCSMKSLSWSSNTLLSFVLHEVVVQVQQHSSQFCAPVVVQVQQHSSQFCAPVVVQIQQHSSQFCAPVIVQVQHSMQEVCLE